ncbi:Ig domain-containing protein [Luteolibacter sp. Populi]|uniref:Ig domain-containing protein n=1 Tax=Luteolibacter sp. Populi TaxID=3230487 RepID=UPI0034677CAE
MKASFLRHGRGVALASLLAVLNASAGQVASLDASTPAVTPNVAVTLNYVSPITEGSGAAEITVPAAWTTSLTVGSPTLMSDLKAFQGNGRLKMDVSMAAPPAGWFQIHVSFQGDGLNWSQIDNVYGGGAFNGTIEVDFSSLNLTTVPENPTWGQLIIITNTGEPHTLKIDNIRVVTPDVPKPSAVYTFDATTDGYINSTTSHSVLFGGSLAVVSPPEADWDWHTDSQNLGPDMTAKMQAAAVNGGTLSVDVFGSAGTLSGFGFALFVQPWTTYEWTQADTTIPGAAVESLPGGMEVARVKFPLSALGADFTSQPGYKSGFGFQRQAGTTIYFDNVMVTPVATTEIDFKDSVVNFTQETGSTVSHAPSPGNGSLYMENPSGGVWGTKAVFNAAAGGEVAALHAKLLKAATEGGTLRFKVHEPFLFNKEETFGGLEVTAALNGTPWQDQIPLWVDSSEFTEGSLDATPPGFTRTVSIPLYPQGAEETDGFVLAAGATNYEFLIGTNFEDATTAALYIDDFEVITAPEPAIIHLPTIPGGAEGIIGRVLTNAEGECTYAAENLPPGVTINPDTGLVVGTPTADGTYEVIFSVTAGGVTASESATWVVNSIAGELRITDLTRTESGMTLTWSGGAAAVNVERSTTLLPGSWLPLSIGDTDGSHLDATPPAEKAFYRVVTP